MADKRITDVDIIDSFSGDMSFFINQNNSIKQINKKNVIIPVSNGGTGVTTLEEMKDMLGVYSDVIPIERGGTGAINARDALINLGAMSMISKTITLEVDNNAWNSNQQTVSVSGVTANNVVVVSPRPTFDDYTAYTESGIRCSAQFDGGLIFTCDEVPSMIITVNVAIFDANNSTGGSTGSSSDGGTNGGGGNSSSSGGTGTGIASVTQTTTSTEDGGVNIITVTLTDGTTSTFRVRNGSKGSKPVKGTDYWTEEDKAEIKSYIDSELLGGAS